VAVLPPPTTFKQQLVITGGIVLSQRGGDFVFECGEDISIGYASHDIDTVKVGINYHFWSAGPVVARY